ncbi:acetate kinase [Buchnera aphidicola]|uniref:Acetate kinase n=1 Tax=Buchnera aphidicola subsp. Melaphis rhois TaxID=118103 RepID=A0A4D6Y0N8_BUCMH|nr:acetate kinase [Buchnera aphidicola]QCI23202.1 acetate kinase [Buchnera aphidicola (Melaphis rhois)]
MSTSLALILNCGSSSLKFSVINPVYNKTVLSGIVDFSRSLHAKISWKIDNKTYSSDILNKTVNYEEIISFISNNILKNDLNIFKNISCIGHRVVHGGSKINKSVIVNSKVIKYIKDASLFAPLHNPINLLGIQASFNVFPNLKKKNVAVFDTAFHSTMPKTSYLYAIPYSFYKHYGIRRYGAHGISYTYIVSRVSKILKISVDNLNVIICHLGNGASVAAIRDGICVDTSMGLTPLEGLVMGTRSGDIDPSIIFFMYNKLKMSIDDIEDTLIRKSGLLGLNEFSNDCRDLEKEYVSNNKIKLSIDIFCHRLSKYISAYTSLMEGKLDAIIFSGGIGENSCLIRSITVSKLSLLNCKIDKTVNLSMKLGREGFINKRNSMMILVIPTNEELVIAKEAILLTSNS